MIDLFTRLLVGFLPVIVFLLALIYLDSYKLVGLRGVLVTIAFGAAAAGVSYLANLTLTGRWEIGFTAYSRYVAPLIEESCKALVIVLLMRTHRIGFLVDAAIYGFAVGAGFAVVENVYYLQHLPNANLAIWIVRGFGTAIMHGGVTAGFGIAAKALIDLGHRFRALGHLGALLVAATVHSIFNHFFLSPILSALLVVAVLPPLVFSVFSRSERSLEHWLNVGFDADTELLELIHSGDLSESPVGRYLQRLKLRFRGEIVADLLCYLRIHVELSLRAKGLLMMRESGFRVEIDDETRAKFVELEYLEKSIGATGKLALAPFLHISDKELWQLYMLRG